MISEENDDEIHERDEMGFFILQDTYISLCGTNAVLSANEWLSVDFIKENLKDGVPTANKKRKTDSDDSALVQSSPLEKNVQICPRCNLILHTDQGSNEVSSNGLQFRYSPLCSFDGTMADISLCNHHQLERNKRQQSKRSDSALLIGNVLKCQEEGYTRIERFEVLIMGDGGQGANSSDQGDNNCTVALPEKRMKNNDCISHEQIRVSMVITVSLPYLERMSKIIKSDESVGYHQIDHYDDYLSTNSRSFDPHGRLFFSLIRSDWDWLDMEKRRLANSKVCGKNSKTVVPMALCETKSLFPDSLSLEELYTRIRGASIPQVASFIDIKFEEYAWGGSRNCVAGNLSLPDEVLQSQLSQFLRAKSLHDLRVTCRYMHQVLRSVVPGMKLKLFPHQVRSLHWMRTRESNSITEDYAMMCGPNNIGCDEVLSGDLFRSITAGGIVSVAKRRQRGARRRFWQINSWSGTCSKHSNERIRTVARCRNVARGGLLCDDPGLGKTITILSLILQTFGQTTGTNRKEGNHNRVSEDLIIDTYWRELLVSYTRRHQLMGLALKLRKCDIEQIFEYPLETVLTKEELVKYRKVVPHPTW